MAKITLIATTKDAPASSDLMPGQTHQLDIETFSDTSRIYVAISAEVLNSAKRVSDYTYGGEIRTYSSAVAFMKDWTNIKTE
ncbi:MAG: hypothetical protein ACRYFX_23740 [Janthinobacterium lividum]